MSLFAKTTFSAAGYAAARPSYPASVFKKVVSYHNAQSSSGTLLDLGCGHGLLSRELSPHFGKVYATDPSPGMVAQTTKTTTDPKITVKQANAEDLSFLPEKSVDMVVAGQAAHWFDYSKTWPELARVVKPGGSLAFWGYRDNVLVGHTKANSIFDHFCYGDGEIAPGLETMKKYWEQPGRNILRDLLRQVKPPSSQWGEQQRIIYDVGSDVKEIPDDGTAWMVRKINLGSLEAYVRTFSACQGWKDAHPEMKSKAEGGQGDLADILMERLVESEPEWKALGENWRDGEATSVWGTYILLAKRLE